MKNLFLPLINKAQMNARDENARIRSLFHRCQEPMLARRFLRERSIGASISRRIGKNRKPVCYHSEVGGNSAAALFDMVIL